jgi:uroporphyrinogen decarboxylase
MSTLTHRERVIKALSHEEPDRVPLDLGGAGVTTTNTKAYARLVKYLGIEEDLTTLVTNKRSMTVVPSERVLQLLDIDTRGLTPSRPDLRPDEDIDENSYIDEWGVLWQRPESGHFINTGGPFQQIDDPTVVDLEKYDRWPDPHDPGRVRGLREKARKLHQETDYAIVFQLPYAVVRECQRVRGFGEWLADLIGAPVFAEGLMERALEVSVGIALTTLEQVGDYVDVVIFPEDLGIQDMCYVRPELYRKVIKPYHRRLVEAIKSKTKAKVLIHSDGAIYAIIGDLIKGTTSASGVRLIRIGLCLWGRRRRSAPRFEPESMIWQRTGDMWSPQCTIFRPRCHRRILWRCFKPPVSTASTSKCCAPQLRE